MAERHTLIINLNESRCGNCGQSADPREQTHQHRLGYTPGPGCGERWVFVTTAYMDRTGRLYDRIRAKRPDLVFVHPGARDDTSSPEEGTP